MRSIYPSGEFRTEKYPVIGFERQTEYRYSAKTEEDHKEIHRFHGEMIKNGWRFYDEVITFDAVLLSRLYGLLTLSEFDRLTTNRGDRWQTNRLIEAWWDHSEDDERLQDFIDTEKRILQDRLKTTIYKDGRIDHNASFAAMLAKHSFFKE